MTAEQVLAEALDSTHGIVTSGRGFTPDEHLTRCREVSPALLAALRAHPQRHLLAAALLPEMVSVLDHLLQDHSHRAMSPSCTAQADGMALLAALRGEQDLLAKSQGWDEYSQAHWDRYDRHTALRWLTPERLARALRQAADADCGDVLLHPDTILAALRTEP